LPGFNTFEMEPGNDPVGGEPEGEVRVMVERNHPAFFLERIRANFSLRVIALIANSRFKAALWFGCASCQTSLIGQRLRVYLEAISALIPSLCETCAWMREVATPRSRFLLCELSKTDAAYPSERTPAQSRIVVSSESWRRLRLSYQAK
jgi:hypothetical protein